MAQWSNNGGSQPIEMCGSIGTDGTLTIGNAEVAAITYTDAQIASNITNVTDIDDPPAEDGEDWTDLVEITGGPLEVSLYRNSTAGEVTLTVNASDTGSDLRAQVLIDDIVVYDSKIVGAGNTTTNQCLPLGQDSANKAIPIFCNTSFKIRAARTGTFANTSSINTRSFEYQFVQKT